MCVLNPQKKFLKDIHRYFSSSGQSLCVAESLTGGLLSFYLSHLPGASNYFKGGIVVYQTEIKVRLLGLSAKMIQQEGLASKACAEAMSQGIKKHFQADWALAVTGFAGPKGGTKGEPVGQVAFAVQSKLSIHSEIKFFNSQQQEQRKKQGQKQEQRQTQVEIQQGQNQKQRHSQQQELNQQQGQSESQQGQNKIKQEQSKIKQGQNEKQKHNQKQEQSESQQEQKRREEIRHRAALFALNLLAKKIEDF